MNQASEIEEQLVTIPLAWGIEETDYKTTGANKKKYPVQFSAQPPSVSISPQRLRRARKKKKQKSIDIQFSARNRRFWKVFDTAIADVI